MNNQMNNNYYSFFYTIEKRIMKILTFKNY